MERIVFFDIDGTLLDEEKRIPPSAIETIERLKENGVRVALATGRAPFMFRDILAQLGIDDFVSFNGQYVEVGGNVLYKRTIDAERLAAIEEAAKARRHPMAFLDENFMTANVDGHPWVETSMNDLKLDPPPMIHTVTKGAAFVRRCSFVKNTKSTCIRKSLRIWISSAGIAIRSM